MNSRPRETTLIDCFSVRAVLYQPMNVFDTPEVVGIRKGGLLQIARDSREGAAT